MGQLRSSSPFFVAGPPARIGEANREILAFVESRTQGDILDLGGGRGAYAEALVRSGHKVTLAEKNPLCLEEARRNGIPVLDANASSLAEWAGLYDTVLLIEVLEHVENPEEFLLGALKVARKRLLLTVPCNDDFEELFAYGLSYNHIAVSDHLHQFTSKELDGMLRKLGHTAKIHTGAFLFPHALLPLFRKACAGSVAGSAAVLVLRVLNRLGLLPKRYPSRIFVEVRLD